MNIFKRLFKRKQEEPPTISESDSDYFHRQIKALRMQYLELQKQIEDVDISLRADLSGEAYQLTALEENLKTLLGIKNYTKTQDDKRVLSPGGLLYKLFERTKDCSQRISKLEKAQCPDTQ